MLKEHRERSESPSTGNASSVVGSSSGNIAAGGNDGSNNNNNNNKNSGSQSGICAGCSVPIGDRFYLLAVDKQWHMNCLRCNQCNLPLQTQITCYFRYGSIYCKEDYQKLFPKKRCSRCQQFLSSKELVMRAKEDVYHIRCFSCFSCGIQLAKGDHFGIRDSLIYCKPHYQMMRHKDYFGLAEIDEPSSIGVNGNTVVAKQRRDTTSDDATTTTIFWNQPSSSPCSSSASYVTTAADSTTGHKGRPRKHPKMPPPPQTLMVNHHSSSGELATRTADLSLLKIPHMTVSTNAGAAAATVVGLPISSSAAMVAGIAASNCNGSLVLCPNILQSNDLSSSVESLTYDATGCATATSAHLQHAVQQLQATRSKRMRTSFKHNQLRTMKSYFNVNQNPDAKDLKQLAQKTGLSKRVLQVWFQNARAKWRRNIMRQESNNNGNGLQVPGSNGVAVNMLLSNASSAVPPYNAGGSTVSTRRSFEDGAALSLLSAGGTNVLDSFRDNHHHHHHLHHHFQSSLY